MFDKYSNIYNQIFTAINKILMTEVMSVLIIFPLIGGFFYFYMYC